MRRRINTTVEILVTVFLLMIAAALILPAVEWGRRSGGIRAACLSNLKQIVLGIKTYTPDYNEWYPTSAGPDEAINVRNHYKDLGILYPNYVSSLDVFTCPQSGDRMPKDRTDDSYDSKPFRPSEAKQVSYAYGYDGSGDKNKAWTEAAPSETRVLADRHASKSLQPSSNHKLDGRNVAFADGHVKWISGRAKLVTNPDHPDTEMKRESWWSER